MAESIKSKANRYARGEFTNRELKIILGGMLADQAIDIATFGSLSRLKGKAFMKVVLPIVRKTARAVPSATARLAGSALGATRFVVMRHPYIAAAVVTYEVVKNREQIKQLLSEGWEMVQDVNEERRRFEAERQDKTFNLPFVGPVRPLVRRARKKSPYNRAVSAGMKALKRSTKMGARGKFTNSKRAFALVSKTASRLRRGIKVTTKGATGIVARSMRNILRRKK
jgi:hypothetical protein